MQHKQLISLILQNDGELCYDAGLEIASNFHLHTEQNPNDGLTYVSVIRSATYKEQELVAELTAELSPKFPGIKFRPTINGGFAVTYGNQQAGSWQPLTEATYQDYIELVHDEMEVDYQDPNNPYGATQQADGSWRP